MITTIRQPYRNQSPSHSPVHNLCSYHIHHLSLLHSFITVHKCFEKYITSWRNYAEIIPISSYQHTAHQLTQAPVPHRTRTDTPLASSNTTSKTAHDSVSSDVFLVFLEMSLLYTST